jgi:hypothetical protein
MSDDFPSDVRLVVEPILSKRGFVLDEIQDGTDDGGRQLSVVYFRSADCKIQIYESAREGETNCMIAPLDAPNEFGLRSTSKKWQFLTRFVKRSDLPLEGRLKMARQEYESYDNPLEWVKACIEAHFDTAHAAMLNMPRPPQSS